MLTPQTPIIELTRVGKSTSRQMEKLGIKTAGDLLAHYPFRYDDYSKILPISEFKTKKSGTIKVKIDLIANRRSPRKKMIITEAIVSDSSDSIKITWFNQPYLAKNLKPGQKIYLAGKTDYDQQYGLQVLNPSYESAENTPIHTGRLVPVYPATNRLSQKQIRFLIRQVLPLTQRVEDWLPRTIKSAYNLISLSFAQEQIHFPQNVKWLERARQRLKFDELFLLQIKNKIIRKKIQDLKAPIIAFHLQETKNFIKNLPFKLTDSQRKSAWEIIKDMEKPSPMNRLLEGDVGSGKTIVAAIAILNTLLNRSQAAYMAPTEILAKQHFETLNSLLKPYPYKIALITRENILIQNKKSGKNTKIKKNKIFQEITHGKINLVIGTHALISSSNKSLANKREKIKFKNLGLAIIDEQHRFGVNQRAALANQSSAYFPHLLSLTATPIPRSVALTLYGDIDLSVISEMPLGRKKILTKIISTKQEKEIYRAIKEEVKKGRQIFVVCPLIDPSDKMGVKSVKEEYEKLSKEIFPELKIGFLHGKMKAEQKEKTMEEFVQNKINILISTTVVEVGIDVPNASTMLIKGAERFGLAQLYQLRGRIGRSQHQSYCFLFSETAGGISEQRLKTLLRAKNGLELAEKDLEMRGPGQVFGVKQSGFLTDLKIAKLSDAEIVRQARQAAQQILDEDPELKQYPLLKNKIDESPQITHLE